MMKTPRRMLRVATLGLAVAALVVVGFVGSVGGIQDDGFFDRWQVTGVSCNGTSGVDAQIIVGYDRTYNHPAGGDVLGTWERTTPAPTVAVNPPFGSMSVPGGSGSSSAIIGTNAPTQVVYPGTYVLSRQILIGGEPTYQQDLTITCSAPGSGTSASSENLFVDPLPALTVTPNPALPGEQVTVGGTECKPLPNGVNGTFTAQVTVTVGFTPPLVMSPTTIDPATGSWSVQFVVPAGTPPGSYSVSASCSPQTAISGFRAFALQANGLFSYPTATITVGPAALASAPAIERTPGLTG